MFSWRAEIIAARNRAFIAGSGWPILAATVISRASLENSFDFWASCRPLRCMMFLNWECPAMRVSLRSSGEGSENAAYRPPVTQNQSELEPERRAGAASRQAFVNPDFMG